MSLIESFEDFASDQSNMFLKDGFVIGKCENLNGLNKVRDMMVGWVNEKKPIGKHDDIHHWMDTLHERVRADEINEIRLHCFASLNAQAWARPTFYSFAKSHIDDIVGNELAVQNRINVSIMMPGDGGSNIPLHVDAHSGESPFQCVLWLPLTDVYESKGMYILSPDANKRAMSCFVEYMGQGRAEEYLDEFADDLIWPEIPYGSFLLFSPTLLHGSKINSTKETRWSFNVRFKSLFSPYGSEEKGLGSFYLPTRLNAATEFGLGYSLPDGLKNHG